MSSRLVRLLLLVCLLPALDPTGASAAMSENRADKDRPAPTDLFGDPLPEGAMARMGTARLKHAGRVRAVTFSPDGKVLASGGEDNILRIWDAKTGKELHTLAGHERAVTCVAFSPDGKILASGSWDKTLRFWDKHTGKELARINHPESVSAIAFSPDGKTLASGASSRNENIYLWDVATGKEVRHWKAHQGGVTSLAFSPDGKVLASGGNPRASDNKDAPDDDYAAAFWDPATGKKLSQCNGQTELVLTVAFSPDGKSLAAAGFDKGHGRCIALWEADTGKELGLIGHLRGNSCFAFAPDGKTIASESSGSIHFWDVPAGKPLEPIRNAHPNEATVLAFSPDGKTLASAVIDGNICLWDVVRRKEQLELVGHRRGINSLAVSPDSKTVATCCLDGPAWLWDLHTGKRVRQFQADKEVTAGWSTLRVAFSPDGKTLAMAHLRDGISFWDVASGKMTRQITGHEGRIHSIAFSPDGKALLSEGIDDRDVHLWEVSTGNSLRKFRKTQEYIGTVAFSPDGRTIAMGADSLYLWDAATGKLLHHVKEWGRAIAFSPDGLLLAQLGGKIRLLEAATAREIACHATGSHYDTSWQTFAYSPDGRFLAVVKETEVRLLEAMTGALVRSFRGHRGQVLSIAFSRDGKTLVSSSLDRTALVWDLSDLAEAKKVALKSEEIESLWDVLKGDDIFKAYGAFLRLQQSPESTVALLAKQLPPANVADPKRVTRLIADLDSDRFQVRDKASRELEELGSATEKALREALKDSRSLETRRRIEEILEKLDSSAAARRAQWAIRLLERLGTPEACRLLEVLAKGEREARLTQEAKATLERLARPSPTNP